LSIETEDFFDENHREIERRSSIMLGMETVKEQEAVASTPVESVCNLTAFNTPIVSPSQYSDLSSATNSTKRTLHNADNADSPTRTKEVILSDRSCSFDDILIGLNHLSYYFLP
jgi:hypothetical protein